MQAPGGELHDTRAVVESAKPPLSMVAVSRSR
jgi:hypothetical protein